jgi:hypothetical protein
MNIDEHLLLVLAEECAEVQQRITKALRFGLQEVQPEQDMTNEQRISYELNDLLASVELLKQRGLLELYPNGDMVELKKLKVRKYMNYAREQGTLSD